MSRVPSALNPTEEDIQLLLSAQCHIGTKNANTRMAPYIHKRRADGKIIKTTMDEISVE
jgi:small subunit ribosomal protein SAe